MVSVRLKKIQLIFILANNDVNMKILMNYQLVFLASDLTYASL